MNARKKQEAAASQGPDWLLLHRAGRKRSFRRRRRNWQREAAALPADGVQVGGREEAEHGGEATGGLVREERRRRVTKEGGNIFQNRTSKQSEPEIRVSRCFKMSSEKDWEWRRERTCSNWITVGKTSRARSVIAGGQLREQETADYEDSANVREKHIFEGKDPITVSKRFQISRC